MFESPFSESLIKRAIDRKLLELRIHDLRDFSEDKHRKVDDVPFGGGPGMALKPEPLFRALTELKENEKKRVKTVLLSPQGKVFDQATARNLAKNCHLIFICAHYEGIDERIMNMVDMELSIGDYILTGGELPAMVVIDCLARFIPGVVKEADSVLNDSFSNGLLDYPVYTRPRTFRGMSVPETLFSGNHKKIEHWKKKASLRNTYLKRPDLLKKIKLDKEQKKILNEIEKETKQ